MRAPARLTVGPEARQEGVERQRRAHLGGVEQAKEALPERVDPAPRAGARPDVAVDDQKVARVGAREPCLDGQKVVGEEVARPAPRTPPVDVEKQRGETADTAKALPAAVGEPTHGALAAVGGLRGDDARRKPHGPCLGGEPHGVGFEEAADAVVAHGVVDHDARGHAVDRALLLEDGQDRLLRKGERMAVPPAETQTGKRHPSRARALYVTDVGQHDAKLAP